MRKDLLALGTFLVFFGLVFVAFSRVAIKPEPLPRWVVVGKAEITQPSENLFVQGNLKSGDTFRVNFHLAPVGGQWLPDIVILINITDPNGHTKPYQIPIKSELGGLQPTGPLPGGVANHTGAYKVKALAIFGVLFNYLALEKIEIEEKESQYPYTNLFPVGVAILLVGFGILFLGVKLSKRKRTLYKRRLLKRKTRS